ncbi:hypothetical protein AHiyo1_51460 [Arthrobacter sp. Hiyo1]|nr:hypothetical protein AHiyo1_51460 [Arthrobacter sp. Hiyo1]
MSRFAAAPDVSGPRIRARPTTGQHLSAAHGADLRGKSERAEYRREITVSRANDLASRLSQEVALAEEEALIRRTDGGVRVTRHEHGRYTVEITREVSFGLTLERDLAL